MSEAEIKERHEIDWGVELSEHRSWLRSVITARVGHSHAVNDIFQEVAAAAIQDNAPLCDTSKIAPWLYRIAVLQSLRYRRTQARRKRRELHVAARRTETNCSPDDLPLELLLRKERRQLVREALLRLSSRDSEILHLKYFDGWSYKQMSERMGITEKTVDSRLHRARGRLRAELAELTLEAKGL